MVAPRNNTTHEAETTHDKIVKVRYRLKHNKALRLISLPAKNLGYLVADETYRYSKDAEEMRSFKNMMRGNRCFIIGNGPSLRPDDLERLVGEYTFGANRVYKAFSSTKWRPTFYCAFDSEFISQEWKSIAALDVPHSFVARTSASLTYLKAIENLTLINCHQKRFSVSKYTTAGIEFSEDPSRVLGMGYSVTFVALQIALWMGFKTIYLLGMDHQYSNVLGSSGRVISDRTVNDHFFKDDARASLGTSYLEGMEFAYQLARRAANQHGARIVNVTRGGALEVFDRANLDEVLTSIESEEQRN